MFAMDEDAPILLHGLVRPLRSLHQLFNGHGLGVACGQVEQLDVLFCQGLYVITVLRTGIDDIRDAGTR